MSAALLEVTHLEASYGHADVLKGIDFSLRPGGIAAILGANGAGKTTTLRAISGLVKRRGRILFEGKPIEGYKPEQVTRLGVGHVPDGRGTFTDLSVEKNLKLGAYSRKDREGVKQDFELVYGYFPKLAERRAQQAGTLSGGEQQMLAISRALMLRPKLLSLDEPSFGLAPLVVKEIFAILRRINQQQKVSVLLVEQNANLALDLADTAYLLETGRIVLSGSSAEIKSDEAVRRSYLGY